MSLRLTTFGLSAGAETPDAVEGSALQGSDPRTTIFAKFLMFPDSGAEFEGLVGAPGLSYM